MTKWESIALAIIMTVIFGGMAVESAIKSQSNVRKADAGLEECSQSLGSFRTIWVKDCIGYTKLLKDNEANEH